MLAGQDRRERKLGVDALSCHRAGAEGCRSASWRIRLQVKEDHGFSGHYAKFGFRHVDYSTPKTMT